MPIVNGCNASFSCLYSFIADFHLLKVKLTKERMHPYNVWIISNVSLLKVKLIRQKIEIFEEKLIVNGCDASYCCLFGFIVDFHPLKSDWQRRECTQYNVRLLSNVWFRRKIEIFEELLIVNGCDASYSCLYSFIVDFHPLKVKLTKEKMHPYNVWIISNVWLLKFKLISQKNWNIRRTAHCKWVWCIL